MAGASAWMPLYVGDYLGDTSRLTTEQHGAYLLLLMDYWRNGPPPNDDAILAQITRLSPDAWSIHKHVLLRFFEQCDGHLRHGRVERELAKAEEHHEKRVARAKKAAEARWADDKDSNKQSSKDAQSNAPSMPQAMHGECPPQSQSHNSSVAKATVATGDEFDPVKALIDDGIRVLGAAGTSEKQARSIIGRWRKEFGDEPVALAIAAADSRGISQPLEWIPRRLATRAERTPQSDDYLSIVRAEMEAEERAAASAK